jgi:drug/metabolite transporter (DMT)-like permease
MAYITFKDRIGQELARLKRYRLKRSSGTKAPLASAGGAGSVLVLLGAFLFAAGGNVVKALFRLGYSPLVLAQMRIWWAFIGLLLSLLVIRPALLRVSRRELPALAIFGGVGLAGVQLSYYLTIARINIAIALLVEYLGLVAVTAFERYHRRQAVGTRIWGALALVLVGAFFAVGAYQPSLFSVNLPGVMLGLVSAGFFAFYLLRASTLAQRLDTWTMLLYGFGAGSLLWVGFDLVTGTSPPADWRIWAVMALLGLVGTLLPHGLFLMALRTIRPSSAGIVATAEPVFAGVIAYLAFGDRLEPLQLMGAAVIITGIVMVQTGTDEPVLATAPLQ